MAVLINVTTGRILARNVSRAEGVWTRLVGLMARSKLSPDDGLWLDRCTAIHTAGMLRRIDVIFLDGNFRIIRVERAVRCFRALNCPGGHTVVELGEPGAVPRDLLVGDRLALQPKQEGPNNTIPENCFQTPHSQGEQISVSASGISGVVSNSNW